MNTLPFTQPFINIPPPFITGSAALISQLSQRKVTDGNPPQSYVCCDSLSVCFHCISGRRVKLLLLSQNATQNGTRGTKAQARSPQLLRYPEAPRTQSASRTPDPVCGSYAPVCVNTIFTTIPIKYSRCEFLPITSLLWVLAAEPLNINGYTYHH